MMYNDIIKHVPILKLQLSTRLVLCKLLVVDDEKTGDKLIINYKELAKLSNCSVKTVQRSIGRLKHHGMITSSLNYPIGLKGGRSPNAIIINYGLISHLIKEEQKYLTIDMAV